MRGSSGRVGRRGARNHCRAARVRLRGTPAVATLQRRMAGLEDFSRDPVAAEAEALCATARWCYARGWAAATSGNFSVRPSPDAPTQVLITPSGLDKGRLEPGDLIGIDGEGQVVAGQGKPSAETALHLVLYRARPEAGAILHVHTVWNTILTSHCAGQRHVSITGYEILKGLSGVTTHEHEERVPLLTNTQDYDVLQEEMAAALEEYPGAHGVLLSRHGLYTWGQSVAEARRHLEALEFLFEVEGRRLMSRTAPPGTPEFD
jgi:methylthioribulose-1-phosphate dehydratase